MRLHHHFQKAQKILDKLVPEDHERLAGICVEIRNAENVLLCAAGEKMHRCTTVCEGLCCRNVQLDAVIGFWDFVYILAMEGVSTKQISECLEKEVPFFSSDCLFLERGVGPCIFPPDVRPEICVTAFCTDDLSLKIEINRVKRKYLKLIWFVRLAGPRRWARRLAIRFSG